MTIAFGGLPGFDTLIAFGIGLLLVTVPLLPLVRPPLGSLLRKATPGSVVARVMGWLWGRPATGRRRLTVLDIAVVLAGGAGVVLVLLRPAPLPVAIGLGVVTLALALTDLRYRLLPDGLVIPLGAVGLLASEAIGPGLALSVVGVVAGGGLLTVVARGYRALRGRDGLGGGDIKLVAAMGAWLGAPGAMIALAAAAATALAVTVVLSMVRGTRVDGTARLPLGAYLAGMLWVLWCVGHAAA